MPKNRVWISYLLLVIGALSGCDSAARGELEGSDRARGTAGGATSDTSRPTAAAEAVQRADRTIRADGIGSARIGMTIGELRTALPQEMNLGTLSPYMVDIDALPVVQGEDTLYHVLVGAGEPSSDDTPIELLATTHAAYRTADGVGPGSTLAQAVAAWGEPVLSYNTNDESREWATFAALPASIMIRVRPASDTASFAGLYETQDEFNQTSRYDPAGRISMVLVGRH